MAWDPVWDKVFSSRAWGKYPEPSTIRFVARNFYGRNRQETRLLEVGCGPGANIWYMSREGFDVYGIDGSEEAIKIAKRRLSDEYLKAHLQTGDILSLPYDDNYFDGVIDAESLYCNDYSLTRQILAEINRVLKPTGLFYSRTFTSSMYVGDRPDSLNRLEFRNVSSGPLAGKGFVRLADSESIKGLYEAVAELSTIARSKSADVGKFSSRGGSFSE